MKKLLGIMLILVMTFCMTTVVCSATDNHGADARSSSMSVDSGEAPIDDESVTREAGGGEIIEGDEDIEEVISEGAPDEEEVQYPEETADSTEKAAGEVQENKEESGHDMLTVYMIIVMVVLTIILIIILVIRSAEKKKTYHSKH